jgi:asparagine synthase (glutamine-hydrolysing)
MEALPLRPIEVATGLVFGVEAASELPQRQVQETPLAALERVIVPALERPPCLVSFSGGRDSSAVLALAVQLARREGLNLPIPATNRFRGAADAAESDWQELVVARLGLEDWHRLEFDDELDAVGPVAVRGLERHGLLWPFNAHFHTPLLEAARGGTLLTGIGGDEQLGESSYARANDVLARRVRPVRRDVLRVGFALSPPFVRALALRRSTPEPFAWLTERGRRRFVAELAADRAREPRPYDRRVHWWLRSRWVHVGFRSLELLAADAGATIVHPLADASVAAALARLGRNPPGGRTERMEALFGDLLPPELISRPTKAVFDEAFWRGHSRRFAKGWRGGGTPADLVDEEALRADWSRPVATPQSLTLLQAAWLAERPVSRARAAVPATDPATPSRADGGAPAPAVPRA